MQFLIFSFFRIPGQMIGCAEKLMESQVQIEGKLGTLDENEVGSAYYKFAKNVASRGCALPNSLDGPGDGCYATPLLFGVIHA
jgi:hypothetical protein